MRVTYAGFVYDGREIKAVSDVLRARKSLMGPKTQMFEARVAKLCGKKYGVMVNSGSSANLLAVEIMNLPEGSEIITPVLTFSTTVAPLVQKRLVPVFVDVKPASYQIDINAIESRITKKTRALFIPSLLGNVPDMARLRTIANQHKLLFVEDSCDTIGATFAGKPTGKYSDITTTSFYGSHIISAAGGGGMVCVNRSRWATQLKVLRGWGRLSSIMDESEDIKTRFGYKVDGQPYDAKFLFSSIGYNFLPLEISAAFGLVQLEKLEAFSRVRARAFTSLYKFFLKHEGWFELPKQDPRVVTNWLAFPLTIRDAAPFSRFELVTYLEKNDIQTRPIFTGNILKQPGFRKIPARWNKTGYPVANRIMKNGFVIGCHHGLTAAHLDYIQKKFRAFFRLRRAQKK